MEMHLATQSYFTGIPPRNNRKQIIIKSNITCDKSQLAGGKPTGYLQVWPRRDSNPGPSDFKSGALTIGPHRLIKHVRMLDMTVRIKNKKKVDSSKYIITLIIVTCVD